MSLFTFDKGILHFSYINLKDIAQQYGTPCYIYSAEQIVCNLKKWQFALQTQINTICYAVKANSNINILRLLHEQGSGFDIVSIGELKRCLIAGSHPSKIVFSGVGKTKDEIDFAINVGIGSFNVESESELLQINELAKKNKKIANIALRINPNISVKTHPYIATGLESHKFGIGIAKVKPLIEFISKEQFLNLKGIACHLGSQISEVEPYLSACEQMLQIWQELLSFNLQPKTLNLGGGFAIRYLNESALSAKTWANAVLPLLKDFPLELIIEPGRSIVGNAGILLTQVLYIKNNGIKNFAIVDAGNNDFLRPSFYGAEQNIYEVIVSSDEKRTYDIVGPICESSDFLAKNRDLRIKEGDYLAVMDTGAYGFSMSSNYNSRPRAIELLIQDKKARTIRTRETVEELFAKEL